MFNMKTLHIKNQLLHNDTTVRTVKLCNLINFISFNQNKNHLARKKFAFDESLKNLFINFQESVPIPFFFRYLMKCLKKS